MKKHLIASILLGGIFVCTACNSVPYPESLKKSYRPMVVEGYHWNIAKEPNDGEEDLLKPYTIIEQFAGDSVVNGQTYKKLMTYGDQQKWTVQALLREDTTQRKIFVLVKGKEHLLYNFSRDQRDAQKLYLPAMTEGTYYMKLTHIEEKRDQLNQIYHLFYYDVFVQHSWPEAKPEDFVWTETYCTMERYGTNQGVYDYMSSEVTGGPGLHLLCAYDENDNVVWSADEGSSPYAGSCWVE